MIYMQFYIHILYVGVFANQWRLDGGQMFDHIVRNWAHDNGSEKDVFLVHLGKLDACVGFPRVESLIQTSVRCFSFFP